MDLALKNGYPKWQLDWAKSKPTTWFQRLLSIWCGVDDNNRPSAYQASCTSAILWTDALVGPLFECIGDCISFLCCLHCCGNALRRHERRDENGEKMPDEVVSCLSLAIRTELSSALSCTSGMLTTLMCYLCAPIVSCGEFEHQNKLDGRILMEIFSKTTDYSKYPIETMSVEEFAISQSSVPPIQTMQ